MPLDLQLNEKLNSSAYDEFNKSVVDDLPWINKDNGDEYLVDPFSVGVINNFVNLKDCDYDKILSDIKSEKLISKSNDLYILKQTRDFKQVSRKCFPEIRNFFIKSVLPYIQSVTSMKLYEDEIDISCSVYENSNYLLCHDDHLESRRIAFIWYLVDAEWDNLQNGGELNLISTGQNGQPNKVCRSVYPMKNRFVFFKVAENSFHEVKEVTVLNKDTKRISINGWFRGPTEKWLDRHGIPAPHKLSGSEIEEELLYKWINNLYLQDSTLKSIRKKFLRKSEIQLRDVINDDQYELLYESLNSVSFSKTGVMTVRQVFVPTNDVQSQPEPIKQLVRLLQSDAFMVVLSMMTGLKLDMHAQIESDDDDNSFDESDNDEDGCSDENDEEETPGSDYDEDNCNDVVEKISECAGGEPCAKIAKIDHAPDKSGFHSKVEIRNWRRGCYSLLCDNDNAQSQSRLDMYLHLGPFLHAEFKHGGYWVYVGKGESKDLLRISPLKNSISLVMADEETMCFMKYFTHEYPDNGSKMYELFCNYYENDS